jgi:hypothetical protein
MVAVVGALSDITQLTWSKSFEYLARACYLNDRFGPCHLVCSHCDRLAQFSSCHGVTASTF